ncbi:efflux RND transporter permease subunit [Thalassotalea mangrovi]|uniref:Efflux RND transporter permease subunit n=1 Tax=Thalassotalea mangrovi TaxID=2572245 RepID=A0A4V5NUS7_9GAMM|nr:efflux RND transporter permease subunit [Thalassotalea mangrovi]TKB46655.1 efflux RND transporter permease subunit [Thalassotalea mangrovi]
MNIAKYAIKTPVNIWLLILIFLLGGTLALSKIGRLEDPAFTIKVAKVVTQFNGASAVQVEQELTEQLEIAIQQMPQLRRLTSISKPGVSEITVEIKRHFDADTLPQIWDELRKRVGDAATHLPKGAGKPQVIDDFGDVSGLYYALTAPDFSAREVREFARIIRRELLTTEGVARVNVNGVMQEQIVANIDPYQLAGLGISFPDVVRLFSDNFRPFHGGRMLVEGKQVRILVEESRNQLDEINNLTLVLPGSNKSIKVRDIARLSVEPTDIQPSIIHHNGEQAITLAVSALNDINIVEVGSHVDAKISEILQSLPLGIEISPIYNQAQIVDEAVDGFILNIVLSVTVVSITLCLFMGWRSGVVVGSVLLITVMGTVLLMWLFDLQLQRISLGAMVIAMGMLVDNAIVVAEGMMLRMRQGKSAEDAAAFIVKRTQWPLLGATIIGIAAFSGIGLSDDATGEFLFSLFAVILISLLLSWVLAVTVTPLFGSYFYQVGRDLPEQDQSNGIYRQYQRLLGLTLRHRALTVGLLVLITVIAYANFSKVKQGFFPPSNAPIFFVHYWGGQGQDIRRTEQVITEVEQKLIAEGAVHSVTSYIGSGAERFTLTYNPQAANESYGLLMVRMHDVVDIAPFIASLPEQLATEDIDGNFYLERMQFGPGGGAKLGVRFSGPDAEVLRELAQQAESILRDDGLIKDIRHDWRQKGLAINSNFDEFNAGVAGVSRADFSDAIQYSSNGLQLGTIQDGEYSYPIVAKINQASLLSNEGTGSDIEDMRNIQVWSSEQRKYIPFQQLSTGITLESEDVLIHRRDRVRTITVMADPGDGETAAQALARIKTAVEAIDLPSGYLREWGGEYESSAEAQQALGTGLPMGFFVMLLISVLLFARVRQPLIIWLVVPMAVVGVVSGLLLTDMPFGFMSLLGFLSLFGMLIKNAIVLIEEIDLQIKEGKDKAIAIVAASSSRLRPVALAAITTILGMAPLLFDPFFADMSVTIMGGLMFATLLTLIAVPVLYSSLYKIRVRQ